MSSWRDADKRCEYCDSVIEPPIPVFRSDIPYRRSVLSPTDWLIDDLRVKDAVIDSLALSVIYFELNTEAGAEYLNEQIAISIPNARAYNVEHFIFGLVQDRVRQLKAKSRS